MIKLYEGGAYLVNGTTLVPEADAKQVEIMTGTAADPPKRRKKGTMAYSILAAHNTSGDMENLKIKFDAMTSHDITFVGIIQTAKASGMENFPLPYVLQTATIPCARWAAPSTRMTTGLACPPAPRSTAESFAAPHRRDPSVYARDDGGRREDDPWVRQPHSLRRPGNHGHRRGRRRAGEAALVRYLRHCRTRAWWPSIWTERFSRASAPRISRWRLSSGVSRTAT